MATSKADADEKMLSYNDVVLRRSDLDILGGPRYINDRLIEFYFAHLSAASPSAGAGAVLLVPPSISFWIANSPDFESLHEILAPLRLRERDLILFTVNNNTDVTLAEGGYHWSLLAYDRRADGFFHHDSIEGLNRWHAEKLYNVAKNFVGNSRACLDERPTPQQRNGYDCGLHVMVAARAICGWHDCESKDIHDRWLPDLGKEVAKVPEMRGGLLRLITDLMEKQRSDVDLFADA